MQSYEREIIKALFQAPDWLDLYSVHQRYRLSPGQVSRVVRNLVGNRLVEVRDLEVKLNEKGRLWVVMNRNQLFLHKTDREWGVLLIQPSARKLGPLDPYLPKLARLNKDFFSRID